MEEAKLNAILQNLNEIVLDLVEQLDESVVTEKALVSTLTELLPGFEKKYEQAYIAERAKIEPGAHELLASLQAEMKKINP